MNTLVDNFENLSLQSDNKMMFLIETLSLENVKLVFNDNIKHQTLYKRKNENIHQYDILILTANNIEYKVKFTTIRDPSHKTICVKRSHYRNNKKIGFQLIIKYSGNETLYLISTWKDNIKDGICELFHNDYYGKGYYLGGLKSGDFLLYQSDILISSRHYANGISYDIGDSMLNYL
jgi:hypothetical protein